METGIRVAIKVSLHPVIDVTLKMNTINNIVKIQYQIQEGLSVFETGQKTGDVDPMSAKCWPSVADR